ncbi:hypothetical protein R3W88_008209 [Solanum pinnatisectum]|uniref:C2H2-type domain-containing protein n=1 Tax=Solanum pinnatisectum TaxID=50273 RepID=A0AAV9M821_9SOLN|nr:hypothetical protein R3W88_008209 [Solanum pinnatisectum]
MTNESPIIRPAGTWCYRCKFCAEVFTSSQGLAGYQHSHRFEDIWIKGAHHHKFFCPSADLPLHCCYLGYLKSKSTVIREKEHLYHPYTRNSVVQSPQISPSDRRSIFDPLLQSMVLQLPQQPHGHLQYGNDQSQEQHTMVQVTQRPSHNYMLCIPNLAEQLTHQPPHCCMSYGEKVHVPPVKAHVTITLTLTRDDLIFQRLNQLAPFEMQFNLNVALSARPLKSTHSPIGSTSSVTTGWMCEKKNDDHEVEDIDLELRL